MNGAAVDRREHAPDGIVQVARLQHGGQSFRIGHGGEVAVVRRANPTRARCVWAKLARRIAAGHWIGRALRQAALEGLALARKAFAIESGIVVAARARAMRGKSRLVGVDKGHALARGIAAALLAARQRPDPGQKLLRHEVHRLTQPLAVDGEGRVHVEAVASARTGRVGAGKRGVAVAHVDDARQISTDQRLERGARLGEIAGQLAIEHLLRILDRGNDAAAIEQAAFGSRLDHDIGDEPGEKDVVGADGEQHQIEAAVGLMAAGRRQELRQRGDLGANRPRTGSARARARALARPLVVEESGIDGCARAAERKKRDGEMRVLDGERERGAHLIAVERAVAGTAEPARALQRPVGGARVLVRHRGAGFVAAEAGASRPVVFTAAEPLEAKALV